MQQFYCKAVAFGPVLSLAATPLFSPVPGSNADMAGWVNNGISGTGTSLSTIRGLALSSADTYGSDWVSPYHANPAKQGFVGIASPPMAPPVATSLSLNGIMPFFAQIQPSDYNIRLPSGVASYSAAAIVSLAASANNSFVNATHRIWCMDDDRFQTGFYAWDNEVVPTLNGGTAASYSTALPTSLAGGGGGGGATLVFNCPTFTSANTSNMFFNNGGTTMLVGNVIQLIGAVAHGGGNVTYITQQNVSSFTTTFTLQFTPSVAPGSTPGTCAMFFVIQNSDGTTNPDYGPPYFVAGGDANMGGYGSYNPATVGPAGSQFPIGHSVGIKFDISGPSANMAFPAGGNHNSTALDIDGGPYGCMAAANDLNPYSINLNSAHQFFCTLVYDGSYMRMTVKDTTTSAQARYDWPMSNLTTITNGTNAWIGFGAGTVGGSIGVNIYNWAFWEGFNTTLATPTISPAAGVDPEHAPPLIIPG